MRSWWGLRLIDWPKQVGGFFFFENNEHVDNRLPVGAIAIVMIVAKLAQPDALQLQAALPPAVVRGLSSSCCHPLRSTEECHPLWPQLHHSLPLLSLASPCHALLPCLKTTGHSSHSITAHTGTQHVLALVFVGAACCPGSKVCTGHWVWS